MDSLQAHIQEFVAAEVCSPVIGDSRKLMFHGQRRSEREALQVELVRSNAKAQLLERSLEVERLKWENERALLQTKVRV